MLGCKGRPDERVPSFSHRYHSHCRYSVQIDRRATDHLGEQTRASKKVAGWVGGWVRERGG